jgi:hypothetical protein
MTTLSLPDLADFINKQQLSHEKVCAFLQQASAISRVAMTASFAEQNEVCQHDYLWALADVLEEAKTLHQKTLEGWYKNFRTDAF